MILIFTDADKPQINGVVTTLYETKRVLESQGHSVIIYGTSSYEEKYGSSSCFKLPGYDEIKLAKCKPSDIELALDTYKPEFVHIATEGPIGLMARYVLNKRKIQWTSSFHTNFPKYIKSRFGFGENVAWKLLKWVYRRDKFILITTNSMKQELIKRGFPEDRLKIWGRGVDDSFEFNIPNNETKILLNVGRVSVEKNLDAFYNLDLPYRKIQVGDGPLLETYRAKYPDVEFVGSRKGKDLVEFYKNADVMVFPSKSDTFGLVMIESMKCGTPVASFPVTGPIDILVNGENGFMDDDLKTSVVECLKINRADVYEKSMDFTWEKATKIFYETLVPIKILDQ